MDYDVAVRLEKNESWKKSDFTVKLRGFFVF